MNFKHMISVIDSHTAGEPTRIIVDGFGRIEGGSLPDKMCCLKSEKDWIRKSLMREPRGHRDMFGGILLPPLSADADAAVIFMDGGKYYNMCGHASLGICAMLVETNRVKCTPPETPVRLETPAGLVEGRVETDENGKVSGVSIIDVPSFAWEIDRKIEVTGYGDVCVDVSFGGNFFVIVDSEQLGIKSIDPPHTDELIKLGILVRNSANEQIGVQHPVKKHINSIDICMITASPSSGNADARNIVILGDAQADRSPCGTGTCARMAVLFEKGKLKLNEPFRHESSIGSIFEAEILARTRVGDIPGIIPRISSRPFITGFHNFVIDPDDPFAEGFVLN